MARINYCLLAIVASMCLGCFGDVVKTDGMKMDPVLIKLFDDRDDFRLVDALAVAIPESSSDQLPRPQQVVRSIWHASGVIGNGGFVAFFHADLDAGEVVKALEEIGAIESVAAMQLAMKVFPDSKPHRDRLKRGEFVSGLKQDQIETIDSAALAFYDADKQRLRALGKYVRSQADSFKGLEAGWVAREYVENLKSLPDHDADPREIASWILGLGGHVQLPDLDGEVQFFNSLYDPLPDGEIVISEIGLPDDRSDTVATLAHISKLNSIKGTLTTVSLQNCDISLDIVSCLADLPALQSLDLSSTNVTDTGIAEFIKLQLRAISLSGTTITDEGVAHLAAMPTLRKIELSRTQVTIGCVDHLGSLPRLIEVDLPSELLTDKNLLRLVGLSSLRSLDLDGSEVTDKGLSLIAKMTNLESLTLDSCSITDSGLIALAGLRNLKSLQLRYTGIGDDGLKHLETLTQLETLDLNSTKVTSGGLASISKLTHLKKLELDSTKITDDGISRLLSLKKLESLGLYETAVGDAAMESVGKITSLVDLSLSDTQVTDTGISKPSGLKRLRDLGFMNTKVTDKSIPVISRFTEIRRMYTSDLLSPEGRERLKQVLKHWQSG